MDFINFKNAVAMQFKRLTAGEAFRSDVSGDELWATYLASFPEGSNPIYKERTEHDCNCCKSFIRAVGNVVAIIDGKLESIWDVKVADHEYQVVADALAKLAKSRSIKSIFLHTEPKAGVEKSFQDTLNGELVWNHFHVQIPSRFYRREPGPALGEAQATHDVMLRGLQEIDMDSIDTVLELIAQNSLYRGDQYAFSVETFKNMKMEFDDLGSAQEQDLFVWNLVQTTPTSVSRIRNTSIGKLLVDLSEGVELEGAVKSFETMVAPANYKRPTALVTPKMIEAAKQKVEELGLTSALERRYATLEDITINNILHANREARKVVGGTVFDDLTPTKTTKPKTLDKIEQVTIDNFITNILPNATSIEVMFENRHVSNLMSLIAPLNPAAPGMFKWDNGFSWTYNGDVADSIKERVKKAGGNVTGDLCCRLAWNNSDDLDFHMREPDGHTIYFGNKRRVSNCGGMLDVDANGGDGVRENPVENIFYADKDRMKEGRYVLKVHQYNRRNTYDFGFEVELDFMGTVHTFNYDKAMRSDEMVEVVSFDYSHRDGIKIVKSLPSSKAVRKHWNIDTETFHKVNVVMLSPNYWDEQGVGNKHYFFMLDRCMNDGQARGFYNEFLKQELDQHRKVLEMVGNKLRTESSENQLSGLGFSSTQRNNLICRVNGSFTRTINIVF